MAYASKEIQIQKQREYYRKHKEEILAKKKLKYAANPESKKEYSKNYRNNNKEKASAAVKRWVQEHKDRVSQLSKDYRERNIEKAREYTRNWNRNHRNVLRKAERNRRSRERMAQGGGWTHEQEEQLKADYGYRCAYCNEKKPLHIDHVVALASGGLDSIENAVPACKSCNSRKHTKPLLIWMYEMLTKKARINERMVAA